MTKLVRLILMITASVMLVSCMTPNQPYQTGGTIVGGILGGILGSNLGHGNGNTAATIGGTVIGGLIGSQIGASMDETDRMRSQQAMNSEGYSQWQSSSTGHHYYVNRSYITRDGRLCRRMSFTDNSGALVEGTACCSRMVNSRCQAWRMVN